jgi:hypothetical protein
MGLKKYLTFKILAKALLSLVLAFCIVLVIYLAIKYGTGFILPALKYLMYSIVFFTCIPVSLAVLIALYRINNHFINKHGKYASFYFFLFNWLYIRRIKKRWMRYNREQIKTEFINLEIHYSKFNENVGERKYMSRMRDEIIKIYEYRVKMWNL